MHVRAGNLNCQHRTLSSPSYLEMSPESIDENQNVLELQQPGDSQQLREAGIEIIGAELARPRLSNVETASLKTAAMQLHTTRNQSPESVKQSYAAANVQTKQQQPQLQRSTSASVGICHEPAASKLPSEMLVNRPAALQEHSFDYSRDISNRLHSTPDNECLQPTHTKWKHDDSRSSLDSAFRAWEEESPDGKWARYNKRLGSGTFKEVWLGIDTESGKEVAWNVVDLRRLSAADHSRIRLESDLLTKLRHPHIIEIYDVWENDEKHQLCFVTEKMSHTLKQHIANLHPAKTKVIKKYCRQILKALAYLHFFQPPIIHRDLKCDNIFIDGTTGDAKLGDFGLAINQQEATSMIGTPGFLAPELFHQSYNQLVDIWAFGMCVVEMATNQFPYMEANGVVSVLLRKGFEGSLPAALDKVKDAHMREFIKMCLQPVECRPSAAELLQNTVFDLSEVAIMPLRNKTAAGAAGDSHTTQTNQESINSSAIIPFATSSEPTLAAPSTFQPTVSATAAETDIKAVTADFEIRLEGSTANSSIAPHRQFSSHNIPSALEVSVSPSFAKGSIVSTSSSPKQSSALSDLQLVRLDMQEQASHASRVQQQKHDNSASTKISAQQSAEEQHLIENRKIAEQLIRSVDVVRTDNPAVVSICLNVVLPAVDSSLIEGPLLSAIEAEISDNKLEPKQIFIPSYDFSKDNYLAISTMLVKTVPELKRLEIDHLEDALASRLEESVRKYYDKWSSKHRSTLNSEVMSLLGTLGINLNYAQKFIEQEVSLEDLFYLTETDMLTFLPKLGPRRRLQQWLETEKEKRRIASKNKKVISRESEGEMQLESRSKSSRNIMSLATSNDTVSVDVEAANRVFETSANDSSDLKSRRKKSDEENRDRRRDKDKERDSRERERKKKEKTEDDLKRPKDRPERARAAEPLKRRDAGEKEIYREYEIDKRNKDKNDVQSNAENSDREFGRNKFRNNASNCRFRDRDSDNPPDHDFRQRRPKAKMFVADHEISLSDRDHDWDGSERKRWIRGVASNHSDHDEPVPEKEHQHRIFLSSAKADFERTFEEDKLERADQKRLETVQHKLEIRKLKKLLEQQRHNKMAMRDGYEESEDETQHDDEEDDDQAGQPAVI